MHTPQQIIEKLLPTLIESAHYALRIQHRIHALEEKTDAKNIFAAALSDADLSIQTHVELALLAHFPEIPFFGEEYKSSLNTKYLAGTFFIDGCEYLITLDPIDGTRPYLDGHKLYQIILTVCSRAGFEAVAIIYPTYADYVVALNGKGAFRGDFATALSDARKLDMHGAPDAIYVTNEYGHAVSSFKKSFTTVYCSLDYSKSHPINYMSSLPRGELSAGIIYESQVIDGAALAFVAREMGCIVETFDGKPMPPISDYPNLILPGVIVGRDNETVAKIRGIAGV